MESLSKKIASKEWRAGISDTANKLIDLVIDEYCSDDSEEEHSVESERSYFDDELADYLEGGVQEGDFELFMGEKTTAMPIPSVQLLNPTFLENRRNILRDISKDL